MNEVTSVERGHYCRANKGGHCRVEKGLDGDVRESNPGPLAPKARIIPLDQHPLSW